MDGEDALWIDGEQVGEVGTRTGGDLAVWFTPPAVTAAELRAIADFLDQLAGADLLSSVVEG
jgi:hypothetical protein